MTVRTVPRRTVPRRAVAAVAALVALAAAWAPPCSRAAEPAPPATPTPNAGSLLRQLQPPPPAPARPPADAVLPAAPAAGAAQPAAAGERFVLRGVRLQGNTAFSDAVLRPLLADAIDQPVDLPGLQALADRLTRHYRAAGYPVAQALLPAQDIVDGRVLVSVVEGHYSAITVRRAAGLRSGARLPLAPLAAGALIAEAPLERALLLMNDLPGVQLRSTLQPGASLGTSELVVDLQPGQAWAASIDADNHGGRSTGRQRLGATLALNNLAGLADAFTVRAQTSDGNGLQYARLGWQLPVNRWGSKLGLAASDMRYQLGGDFQALQASGRARISTVFASHPLLRSRSANLQLQLLADDKRLRDRVNSADTVADKTVQVLALAASGDRADGWGGGGNTAGSLTWSSGRLRLLSPEVAAQDSASARTAGRFDKLSLSLQRQQSLGAVAGLPLQLGLQYTGQWAPQNLDSSEKFGLAGVDAVRAYPAGEASVDQAQLLTAEVKGFIAAGWQLSLFADAAHGRINARPWDGASGSATRRLAGAGLGLLWAPMPALTLQLQYAQRLGSPGAAADQRRGQGWLQMRWAMGAS